MRLINIKTARLEDCPPHKKRPYAVLSHRWTKDEVTFDDIYASDLRPPARLSKFWGSLRQAKQDGLGYVWIDTCCIDKGSSSELSEAINSMYRWYQRAEVCYVYLQDVEKATWQESFPRSKWFTRGWTLQELLAPRAVVFYDRKWRPLGDKIALATEISRITSIAVDALQTGDLSPYSVAQKMSWAAKRVTTRPEDQAYCLMGLFGVNMPLLYGEGEKAFFRLQEEIIKSNDDYSIFAWSMGKMGFSGLLAPAPGRFAGSSRMISYPDPQGREPFSMTNRGLSIKLTITPWAADTYLAYLDCAKEIGEESGEKRKKTQVGVFLRRLQQDDQYVRINDAKTGLWFREDHALIYQERPTRDRRLFVRQTLDYPHEKDCLRDRVYGFKILDNHLPTSTGISAVSYSPKSRIATLQPGGWGCVVVLDVSAEYKGLRKIALGFDFEFHPVCLLGDSSLDPAGWKLDVPSLNDWSDVLKDDVEWEEISKGSSLLYRKQTRNGRWALKGHRLYGLDVLLAGSSTDKGSLMSVKRDEGKRCTVWEFDIDSLVGPFRNLYHQALKSSFGTRKHFQRSYGLGETDEEDLEEGDDYLRAMFPSFDLGETDEHLEEGDNYSGSTSPSLGFGAMAEVLEYRADYSRALFPSFGLIEPY